MPRGLTPTEFAIDLERFGDTTREQAKTIFQKITLDLDRAVVLATPVDTGRARGNWFPSLQRPSSRVKDDVEDKTGQSAINAQVGVVNRAKLGDTLWLTNNLPYVLVLENGSSKQAPMGMVDFNLERVAQQYGGKIQR